MAGKRPYAPREIVLFGVSYHRGVPAATHVDLFRLYRDHQRADVREMTSVAIDGEEFVKVSVTYYIKVNHAPKKYHA